MQLHSKLETMAPPFMTLRASEISDAPNLYEAAGECIKEMAALGLNQWDAAYPSVSVFENDAAHRAGYVFPASGEIHGYFALTEQLDSDYASLGWSCAGRAAVFKRLLVRPRYGRQGLGRALLSYAELSAKSRGIEALRLDTFSSNQRATNLFRSAGYKTVGHIQLKKGESICFEKSL